MILNQSLSVNLNWILQIWNDLSYLISRGESATLDSVRYPSFRQTTGNFRLAQAVGQLFLSILEEALLVLHQESQCTQLQDEPPIRKENSHL